MSPEVRRVLDAIAAPGEQPEDAVERFKRLSMLLKGWPELHSAVRALRQGTGEQLHSNGMTYDAIGQLIDVTESRARHIVKGITVPSRQKKRPRGGELSSDTAED